jgi:hypothetical protein
MSLVASCDPSWPNAAPSCAVQPHSPDSSGTPPPRPTSAFPRRWATLLRTAGALIVGTALAPDSLRAATAAASPSEASARSAPGSLTEQAPSPGRTAPSAAATPVDDAFFLTRVEPVLRESCHACHSHSAERIRGGLVLDSRSGLLQGGSSGPAIVPGDPAKSLLIQAVRHDDPDLQMPPADHGPKLPDPVIADLTAWVAQGAPMPAGTGAYSEVAATPNAPHWAFQTLQRPAVPATNDAWGRSPIDAFIRQRLEASELAPNAPADPRTLLRRVTFDLTGLPPTADEVAAFVSDDGPEAFARVVDRLLASPHYGERMARLWMDLARYSDTKGDPVRRDDPRFPHAWTYRDYLIEAFNQDRPYADFIREQIAADLLIESDAKAAKDAGHGPSDDHSRLAALGFLTLGNQHDGRRNDIIDDRIDVISKAFLGLTVSCARCHDHKFDPIPTADYYSLYGVLANTVEPASPLTAPALQARVPPTPELEDYLAQAKSLAQQDKELRAEFAELRRRRQLTPDRRRELIRREGALQREIAQLELTHAGAPARAPALTDAPRSRDYPILLRGEAGNTGETVPRRFLTALSPHPAKRPTWRGGSGRLELAEAIADPRNPMTARVLVNRLWQQHFGRGFVDTPDDLGRMGGAPSHPELLDWLATEFLAQGGSIKQLHRVILLSSTYQQAGGSHPAGMAADPENRLLWRAPLRRLSFEQMHDSLLAISGTLDPTIGGRSILPNGEVQHRRRALYLFLDRRNPPELFTQWDYPNPDVPSGRRYLTTVPQQALFLMNSALVIETARELTRRATFQSLADDPARVTYLYQALFQREPTAAELSLTLDYVQGEPALSVGPATGARAKVAARERANPRGAANRAASFIVESRGPLDAWTRLAHALFQSNEAIYLN